MKIILPKILAKQSGEPVFFLMGPIRGGGDWQHEACKLFQAKTNEGSLVAVPCRYGPDHPLYDSRAEGHQTFSRQLTWERYYLNQAGLYASRGCIIVWLPAESKTDPRKEGPYARDTYGELGEWRGRMMCKQRVRFIVGAETDFPGLDVITRNFELALDTAFWISPTLEETVTRAIEASQRPAATTM